MIESLLVWALWPVGIFAVVEVLKRLDAFRKAGRWHKWVFALPVVVGAVTGPWGAPWIIADNAPPFVISVLIGAGAGLCSQGIYDWWQRRLSL